MRKPTTCHFFCVQIEIDHLPARVECPDCKGSGYAFCKDHLWKDGSPSATHCMVIDLASGKVYPGVKSIKPRLKDVESACGQIASLWPGITK